MGNEIPTGYAVLDLRVSELEKDLKELNQDLKSHIQKNDDEHKEMRASIAESALSLREIKIMFAQIVATFDEMKKDIKDSNIEMKAEIKILGEANNKEKGWRAIIADILKIIIMIIAFVLSGKLIL